MPPKLPHLTPFWYTPEGQDDGEEVSFRLRPLTQPQMVEVEEHYDAQGNWTQKAQYVAGTLGIIAVKGIVHPETGDPAIPPSCFTWLHRRWTRLCGLRLICEDGGYDWEKIMAPFYGQEPEDVAAPAQHEGLEKN